MKIRSKGQNNYLINPSSPSTIISSLRSSVLTRGEKNCNAFEQRFKLLSKSVPFGCLNSDDMPFCFDLNITHRCMFGNYVFDELA